MTRGYTIWLLTLCSAPLAACGARTDLGADLVGDGASRAGFTEMVLADANAQEGGRLLRYDTLAELREVDVGSFAKPCAPTFDEEARLVFLDLGGRIVRVAPDTGSIEPSTVFTWIQSGFDDLAVDGHGGFYVADSSGGRVAHVPSIGAEPVFLQGESLFVSPTGIGLSHAGKLVVVDGAARSIIQFDDIGGANRQAWTLDDHTSGAQLLGLAFDSSDRIYFADNRGGLHRIDDISGAGHVVFGPEVTDFTQGFWGVEIGPDDTIYATYAHDDVMELWIFDDMEGNGLRKLENPAGGFASICGGPAVR